MAAQDGNTGGGMMKESDFRRMMLFDGIFSDNPLNSRERAILGLFVLFADWKTWEIKATHGDIAKSIGMSVRCVGTNLRKLRKRDLVSWDDAGRGANTYKINTMRILSEQIH